MKVLEHFPRSSFLRTLNKITTIQLLASQLLDRELISPRKREENSTLPRNSQKVRNQTLLVEFKAPKELVKAFDLKLKSKFSNRSEAIRSLMRRFLEATSKEN